ncbi:MAG: SigE family RNA polymerase sigma factor [Actinomycetota bacterium]
MNEAVGTLGERAIAVFRPSTSRLDRLGEWFAAEYESLLRFAYFLTGERAAAEDLVQDTFVRLYGADRRIEEAGFTAYARRTMVNLRRSMFRRRAPERRALATQLEPSHADPEPTDHVWRAILKLPRQQRACVALRFYEDLTEQEIADTLGVTIGTIKKQMHRAMNSLRQALGERSEP